MKRIGFFVLFCLVALNNPIALQAASVATEQVSDPLPWPTIELVLKKVSDKGQYAYNDLVRWYYSRTLTIAKIENGTGYTVTILKEDGVVDVMIIDNL